MYKSTRICQPKLQEVSPLSATPGTIYPQWPVMDAAQDAIELLQEDLGMDANMDDELEVGSFGRVHVGLCCDMMEQASQNQGFYVNMKG